MSNISNRWVIIFLILPHLSIYYFKLEQFRPVIFIWQSTVILLALFLIYRQINTFNILMIFYMVIVMLSAVVHGTLSFGVLYTIGVFLSFCIYISYAIKNFNEFITGLYYLLTSVAILNFLTMLLHGITIASNGDYAYLLGGKNAISLTLLPTIPLIYLYSYTIYHRLKLFPLIVILICIISTYLSESGTGIVVSLLTIIFVLFPKKLLPSFYTYLLAYFITFFSIVIFRLQEILFGDFIVDVLHKDMTFTGRTYIWDLVLNALKNSWFLGLGRGNSFISNNFINLSETHNGILEVLMFSGIMGCLLFSLILLIVGKKLFLKRKHIFSKILSFSIFTYLIIGLTESVFYKIEFWILLIISYNIENIIKHADDNKLISKP
ncbi:O-antigen ligase family protein [Priestia aryabhattai]|uniref:O-antigen ligase family protein n=1 Tax=Priestia aryabhattai TaxID=412384 RepID=UPI003D2DA15A